MERRKVLQAVLLSAGPGLPYTAAGPDLTRGMVGVDLERLRLCADFVNGCFPKLSLLPMTTLYALTRRGSLPA